MKSSMALLSALLCACTVGEAPTVDGGGNVGDDKNVCEPRVSPVPVAHAHTAAPTGARSRTACMDAGCHAVTGGASTPFAFAGTVNKESAGVNVVAGATVRIFKVGGNKSLAEAVTDDAGNFLIRNPAMFTEFPYITHVTACGVSMEIRLMSGPIDAAAANCSAGTSCHGAGGSQGAVVLAD